MIKITDEMMEAGLEGFDRVHDMDVTAEMYVRSVIEAVLPLIARAEREACAKIPDAFVKTADEFEAKGVKHTMAVRTTALGIASLIRARPHA
jgi:hypothetical protein